MSEEAIKAGFDFQCSNNEVGFKWMIGFPNTEVGQYAVEVSGVRDEAGNDASPFTFVMDANCAPASKDVAARFSLGAMQRSAEKTGDAPTTLFDVPVASMPSAWILAGCCLVAGVAIFAGAFPSLAAYRGQGKISTLLLPPSIHIVRRGGVNDDTASPNQSFPSSS